jgi:hypothetical protein
MLHSCPRCNYTTRYKSHLIDHLSAKNICPPVVSDVNVEQILMKLHSSSNKSHVCDVCYKGFSHSCSLRRHMKVHIHDECPKPQSNVTNNNIQVSHNENMSQQHTHQSNNNNSHNMTNCHNTTTNNNHHHINIQNVTMNVNILPFGKEDIQEVENDQEFLTKCLKNILQHGIPDLVQKIYFNEELPQNRNVKLVREHKPSKMLVYVGNQDDTDGGRWEERPMDITVDTMIDKGCRILIKHNNQLYCIDKEIMDLRNEKFSKIHNKQRGVYGNIKHGVISKAREMRSRDAAVAATNSTT